MTQQYHAKIGTNPKLSPMNVISIGYNAIHPRPWYLADEAGNEVRDYSEYETQNGYCPVIHFKTQEAAIQFARKIPPPAGYVWVDCDFSHTKGQK